MRMKAERAREGRGKSEDHSGVMVAWFSLLIAENMVIWSSVKIISVNVCNLILMYE